MEEDAEDMRLPDGEMPPVGGRLPAIEEEFIEGGINLSEELAEEAKADEAKAEEAKAQESLGETKEPAKPQTSWVIRQGLSTLAKVSTRSRQETWRL